MMSSGTDSRMLFTARRLARVAAGVLVAGCASARPEQKMTATDATGRLVPLDSITTSFTVGGIKVIQRPNFANDVVAVNLYLLGGTRQLTPATQGIESLLLHVAEYGSANYPHKISRTAWGMTGSRLVIEPDVDWTLYGFRGIRQEFDSTWNIFTDRLMHPALAAADVQLVRSRLIARIRHQKNSPDGYAWMIADSVAYAGHPYGLQPEGTEATLAALDSAGLARYAAEQMMTSRMLLVVVGQVPKETIEAAIQRTLAKLPAGTYAWKLPEPQPRANSNVAFIPRDVATNYVLGFFEGPGAAQGDYSAFHVAVEFLSSEIRHSVREERGLSYAAMADYLERGITTGAIYVTTTQPTRVMEIIKSQIDSIRNIPMGVYSLRYFTDQFIMDYMADNMTNAAQADFLARAQLYRGDFHRASQAMEDLRGVGMGQMRAAADRYFRNIHFVYIGDTTRVERSAFTAF